LRPKDWGGGDCNERTNLEWNDLGQGTEQKGGKPVIFPYKKEKSRRKKKLRWDQGEKRKN